MNVPGSLHYRAFLLCVFKAVSAGAQELPAVPPSVDPAFWGHPNKPYILKLTVASTIRDGSKPQQTRTSEEDVVRDSLGRVRTETFYESGRPNSVSIRDPNKNTFTFLKIVNKTAFIISLPKHMGPSPEKGWDVEPLPSRVIAGIPAEGSASSKRFQPRPTGKHQKTRLSKRTGFLVMIPFCSSKESTVNAPAYQPDPSWRSSRLSRMPCCSLFQTATNSNNLQRRLALEPLSRQKRVESQDVLRYHKRPFRIVNSEKRKEYVSA